MNTNQRKYLWLALKIAIVSVGLVTATVVITQLSINNQRPQGLLGIVGGKDARPKEFPWQVSLQIVVGRTTRSLTCGGTLIDATHVVTAAHCGAGMRNRDLEVVAGAYKVKNTAERHQQRVGVESIVRHPEFNLMRVKSNRIEVKNDVAVITLSEPVIFNEYVQPLRLPPRDSASEGQVCETTGWGNANPTGDTSEDPIIPNKLQTVNLTIVNPDYCKMAYGWQNIYENMICAHDFQGGKGPCNGDSGGPLVCYDTVGPYLAGITSFGSEICGAKEAPNVFTRVSSMVDFIKEITQDDLLLV